MLGIHYACELDMQLKFLQRLRVVFFCHVLFGFNSLKYLFLRFLSMLLSAGLQAVLTSIR